MEPDIRPRVAWVACYLEGCTAMKGPETREKRPVREVEGPHAREAKLERVDSKLKKHKDAHDISGRIRRTAPD